MRILERHHLSLPRRPDKESKPSFPLWNPHHTIYSSTVMAPSPQISDNSNPRHSNKLGTGSLDNDNKPNSSSIHRWSSSYYSSTKGAPSRRTSTSAWTGSTSISWQSPGKTEARRTGRRSDGGVSFVLPGPRRSAAAAARGPERASREQQPVLKRQQQQHQQKPGPGWTCCQCGEVTTLRWLDCDNRRCRHYRCGISTSRNHADGEAGGRGPVCVINKGPGMLERMRIKLTLHRRRR